MKFPWFHVVFLLFAGTFLFLGLHLVTLRWERCVNRPTPEQVYQVRFLLNQSREWGSSESLLHQDELRNREFHKLESDFATYLTCSPLSRDDREILMQWHTLMKETLTLLKTARNLHRNRVEALLLQAGGIEAMVKTTRKIQDHGTVSPEFRRHLARAKILLHQAESWLRQKEPGKAEPLLVESRNEILQANETGRAVLSRFLDPEYLSWCKNLVQAAYAASLNHHLAILILKDDRRMDLLSNGRILKSFSIELGPQALKRKLRSGDLATPEGSYHITQKKGHGKTVYTLALLLDYPNSQDRERFKEAKARGEIPHNARIGGLIEIHGSGGRGYDWTEGCAALSDEDMKWLFHRVQVGTPVFIVGTDGVQNSISKTLQSLGP